MSDFFFISYSSVDGRDFATRLADDLVAGPPSVPIWLDRRTLRPGEDWDEQVGEAIRTCKGLIFVLTADSVRPDSVCKHEWARALKYKKPVIPVLLDRDAELPFRLGSREYVSFAGSFDAGIARLRKHLAWMDSPEGQLQALRHRLSDAQRELPRADADRQARVREDIAELERQIAQQQRVIDDPRAAEERVQQSIETGLEGERRPDRPVGGMPRGKFVNPPPLIAPTWFQDRHQETRQVGAFLADDSLRLMTLVGRGGVGKTAMVCRLLRALEGGRLPDDGPAMTVDGIVYLSAARSFHRPNVPDLYAGLTKLLPPATVTQLDAVYRNPHATTRATMEALVQAFPHGRTVVLLDNFEDMLSVETGEITDAELDEALRALLELPPHALKVIITTRVAPPALALVQPGLQRRLDLDSGLAHPYAEEILRSMDADGKVGLRDAPDALLARARERTLGYPRALEHLFGILSADRDTSLQEILDDTRAYLPEQVVAVLVGEAFSRLDPTAQRVMQALAVYRYPVPPAAVDYLLHPHVPGIDSSRVLSRLVNMQFVHRDAGRYYLHQVDRDYALSRIAEGAPEDRDADVPPLTRFALRHRAAEWFRLSRKPRSAWKSLGDLTAQLSEFELRYEGADYDRAATLLLEIDYDYLFLWGHYRLMTELHERLQGRVTDPDAAQGSVGNLGSAYYRMGDVRRAIAQYERALHLAREHEDRVSEGVWTGNLGTCYWDLGQHARAVEQFERALVIDREVGNKKQEANDLGNLGVCCTTIGEHERAIAYHEDALRLDRELASPQGESEDLHSLGSCLLHLGRYDESARQLDAALALSVDIGYRLTESGVRSSLGELRLALGEWDAAAQELERAIAIADDIGSPEGSQKARVSLALVALRRGDLPAARALAAAAQRYDVPLLAPATSAMLGVVTLRAGDVDAARDAFAAAVARADALVALNGAAYATLDVKGLALCGLALCGDAARIADATAAYDAARAVTCAPGTVRLALRHLDALAPCDAGSVLAEVRPVAAGERMA